MAEPDRKKTFADCPNDQRFPRAILYAEQPNEFNRGFPFVLYADQWRCSFCSWLGDHAEIYADGRGASHLSHLSPAVLPGSGEGMGSALEVPTIAICQMAGKYPRLLGRFVQQPLSI